MIKSLISKATQNSFIRGGFIFTSASFLVSILHYIFNLLIARGFTLSSYGEYMSAFSYIAILTVPFSALNVILINRISRAKIEDRANIALAIELIILKTLTKYSVPVILLAFIIFFILLAKTNLQTISIFFILALVLLSIFNTFYSSVLQAYKSFFMAGSLAITLALLKLFLGSGVMLLELSLEYVYISLISLSVVGIILGAILIRFKRKISKNLTITYKPIQSYVLKKQVILPTITMLGIIGMLNVDIIIVKKFFAADQAGLYAGLSLLGKIILYATTPLNLVAFTFFTGSEHSHNKKHILLFSTTLTLIAGSFAGIMYYLFSDLVISIIFGSKFLVVSQYVWLTAVFGTLYSIVSLFAQYAISKMYSFALFSVFGLAVQTILLYSLHSSFYDVLIINSSVLLLLALFYGLSIIKNDD